MPIFETKQELELKKKAIRNSLPVGDEQALEKLIEAYISLSEDYQALYNAITLFSDDSKHLREKYNLPTLEEEMEFH